MATSPPHHTYARVTLLPDSGHFKSPVVVDVPPPLGEDDEFLMPRARFDEAAGGSHVIGDRVQVGCPSSPLLEMVAVLVSLPIDRPLQKGSESCFSISSFGICYERS
jgi:hypothetical protein